MFRTVFGTLACRGDRWVAFAAVIIAITSISPASADDGAWFNQIISASKGSSNSTATSAGQRSSRSNRPTRTATARPPRERPAQGSSEPSSASLTGGGITWQASSSCVPGALRGVLADLVGNFGPVTVTSTCRGRTQNRVAGGAGQSYHLTSQAVDFRVRGSTGAVYAYLASNGGVGGLKHYGGGLFHIDTGPRRSW